jgi:hypothetical protein
VNPYIFHVIYVIAVIKRKRGKADEQSDPYGKINQRSGGAVYTGE